MAKAANNDDLKSAEQEVRRRLVELTGFEYAVFAPTGTAAFEVLLEVYSGRRSRVGVPALGCWTLPYAVTKLGRRVEFLDIDRYWGPVLPRGADLDVVMMFDPWGGPCDWGAARRRRGAQTWLLDLTHAPGATLSGARPGEAFDGGIISFGGNKPLGLGGGGVALFNDPAAAREAIRLQRFGFRDGHWRRRIERYTYSPHLHPPLLRRLARLSEDRSEKAFEVAAEVFADGLLEPIPLRPEGGRGWASVLALQVPRSFPLSPRELEAVVVSSGQSLARYPVGPAYQEPAWGRRATAHCPRAERLAPRLLFHTIRADVRSGLLALRALIEQVLLRPQAFRTPYVLPPPQGRLPPELIELQRTAFLVRTLSGDFGMIDEDFGMMIPVTPAEAALLQARRPSPGAQAARPSRRSGAKAAKRSSRRGKGSP